MLLGERGLLIRILRNEISPKLALEKVMRLVEEGEFETAPESAKKISMFFKLCASEIFHIDIAKEDIDMLISKCK